MKCFESLERFPRLRASSFGRVRASVFLLVVSVALPAGAIAAMEEPTSPKDGDFNEVIKPILESRCYSCHGPEYQDGNLRLDRPDGLFGEKRKILVAGDPAQSEFYKRIILPADDFDIMPAEGDPLTKDQIASIKQWIEKGAEWPAGAKEEAPKKPEGFALSPLSEDERTQQDEAMAKIKSEGAIAMRIAANTEAIDVNLSLRGAKVKDDDLQSLAPLSSSLVWLNLSRTGVSDQGMSVVGKLKELRRLNLSNTSVTDAGLATLKPLSNLSFLNLYGTKVSDRSIETLKQLEKLEKVYLWQTDVSKEAVESLKEVRPELVVDTGQYLTPPAEEDPEASQTLVNSKCPVSGTALAVGVETEFEGHRIGFCCENCLKKFLADPEAYREKLDLPDDKVAVNKTCPVSDKAVDTSITVEHEGHQIAFCCANCKGAFEKDPKKFVAKIPELKGK